MSCKLSCLAGSPEPRTSGGLTTPISNTTPTTVFKSYRRDTDSSGKLCAETHNEEEEEEEATFGSL